MVLWWWAENDVGEEFMERWIVYIYVFNFLWIFV